jgi:hypothetical protein
MRRCTRRCLAFAGPKRVCADLPPGTVTPPSNPTPLRAMLGRGPPTLPQYFLNPRYAHRVLVSEVLYYLSCSEFGVPLPYRAYPDSCGSPAIKLPPYLPLRRTMPDTG